MKILAFDTSLSGCSVAICQNGQVIAYDNDETPACQAKNLLYLIDSVLNAANFMLSDMDAIAITIGPGSFTGIRIGLSAALGFRLVTKLPLLPVLTLEAMAYGFVGKGRVMALIDAGRGEFYMQEFDSNIRALGEAFAVSGADLQTRYNEKVIIRHPEFISGSQPIVEKKSQENLKRAQGDIFCEQENTIYCTSNPSKLPFPAELATADAKNVALFAAQNFEMLKLRNAEAFYIRGADAKLPGGIDPNKLNS